MNKWIIVAYPDEENRNKKVEKEIEAVTRREALMIAWNMFPEYHEVGVYRKGE